MIYEFKDVVWRDNKEISFTIEDTSSFFLFRLLFKRYGRKFVSGKKGSWISNGVGVEYISIYYLDMWYESQLFRKESLNK